MFWRSRAFAATAAAILFALTLAAPVAAEDPPAWDFDGEYKIETFTADRAQVNKNGGLTIDGSLWCPALVGHLDPYLGIEWTATQYLGRKGAITATYEPAIAHPCYDSSGGLVHWATKGPGTQDKTMWIYAPNGKFGAGTVHVELRTGGQSSDQFITQRFDPTRPDYSDTCSMTPDDAGFYDSNGDGYCAYNVLLWGDEQFDLRVARAR